MLTDIDLEPIMVKIMDKDEGLGWSLDKTKKIALEYEKFLLLCKENPNKPIVPATEVDDFWHFHILDTYNYQKDCMSFFGYFLHHFPYFGMRGENDAQNLATAWHDTCELYKRSFGNIDKTIWYASKRCPNCGRRSNDQMSNKRPRLSGLAA